MRKINEIPPPSAVSLPVDLLPDYVRTFTQGAESVWMLTVLPGFERVAADEVEEKLRATVRATMRGKVFFTVPPKHTDWYEALRCADNIYAFIYTGTCGSTRDGLRCMREDLAGAAFGRVIDRLRERVRVSASGNALLSGDFSCTVNASVTGKHTYSRFEAADAFMETLTARYGLVRGTDDNRDVEFRLDIIDGRCLVFVKHTNAAYRFRGVQRGFVKAALRPTVAHALVRIAGAGVGDGEVVLDPFCGSGTILCERAVYPYAVLMGGDKDSTVLATARENLRGTRVQLFAAEADVLPIDAGSVDTVVTNPPWGGQIDADDPFGLYLRFLRGCTRYLTPSGTVVVLTPLSEALKQAAAACGFDAAHTHTVSLHGTLSFVFRLVR